MEEKTVPNTHTTVVPLTQEWVSELRGSTVDDAYGLYFILEKFLTSLSECEIPDTDDAEQTGQGIVLQCDPGTGHQQMSCTYQCIKTTSDTASEHISDADIAEIIPSGGEQNTSGYHVKATGSLPINNKVAGDLKLLERFTGQDMPDDCEIEAWQYLSRSEAGTIYYSEEEDWMSEQLMSERLMGHAAGGPNSDRIEEMLALPTSSQSDGQQPESDRSREEDPIELDQQPDHGLEEASYSYLLDQQYLLDPFEGDQLSESGTEDEAFYLLDQQYLLDPFEVDHQSKSGTDCEEEAFYLLDPIEVPMVNRWQNSIPEQEDAAVKRLSRYDLFYGPTQRARSPSCPLIGARGDSRERSPIINDDFEISSLQHMALYCSQEKGTNVRTTRRTKVQTVTWKTHPSHSQTPCIVIPLLGCPCWLLLMGLLSLVIAVIDVK
ncbi:Hypp1808 [Branchiostoma lanceolatum]|uniref:Hypp1808 protein n=1 Tax=Branchiostoma lanceolatum TaxID=7740 RepID=A0A8J9ZMZ8_BRALA|nr:Hypp1808 [Branchiostoma lanceolatum]